MYLFNSLVLKIASRCNLNCSYCFMYNLGDESYLNQPKFMSVEVVDAILEKVKNYVLKYDLKTFDLLFHGGEPLLVGVEFLETFISKAKKTEAQIPDFNFTYSVQTNGVLINEKWCDLFKKYNVAVGISIDGTKDSHDKYRLDHKGNGSYEKVKNAAAIIKNELGSLSPICVIDVNSSPKDFYQNLKTLQADFVNILLPDYTYQSFPNLNNNNFQHADWLIELFDLWFYDKEKITIYMFKGIINRTLGLFPTLNTSSEEKALVIETNGEIEPIDSLKACGHNFTKTGLNIKTNTIDDVFNSSIGKLYFIEDDYQCEQCLNCPIFDICRGGRLVHRYNKENGFLNPSVYCHDLIKFIGHVQHVLLETFPDIDKEEVYKIEYKEVIEFNNQLLTNS